MDIYICATKGLFRCILFGMIELKLYTLNKVRDKNIAVLIKLRSILYILVRIFDRRHVGCVMDLIQYVSTSNTSNNS